MQYGADKAWIAYTKQDYNSESPLFVFLGIERGGLGPIFHLLLLLVCIISAQLNFTSYRLPRQSSLGL